MILYRKSNCCIEGSHAKKVSIRKLFQSYLYKKLPRAIRLEELGKQIGRIWDDVAKCYPLSAHLSSPLSSCWRIKHPSAQTSSSTQTSMRAPQLWPLLSPPSPVKLHFRLKPPLHSEKVPRTEYIQRLLLKRKAPRGALSLPSELSPNLGAFYSSVFLFPWMPREPWATSLVSGQLCS